MGEVRSFDRIADRYDETRGGEERGHRVAGDLHPLFADNTTTLEVGIGTGLIAKGLADLGRPIVGVDIAPLMLSRAHERIGARVAVGDASALPVRSRSIANAYAVWVLHLINIPASMAEVARVLVSNGRYLVCTYTVPEPDPIQDIIGPMYRALADGAPRADADENVIAAAENAGLTFLGTELGAEHRFTESPERVAQGIERRDGSAFWDLDDDRWERCVTPALRALRALPDPTHEIVEVQVPRILVFRR